MIVISHSFDNSRVPIPDLCFQASDSFCLFVNIRLDIEGYLRFVLRAPPHHLRDDVYWHGEHDGRVVLLGDVVQGLEVAELKRKIIKESVHLKIF